METIFGIPTTSIMVVLLVLFAICMSFGGWIVLRQRVVFRLGVRNIPRRPAQTILIVIGLMLSTVIIAAAFTTGDTLNHSIRSEVYDTLGQVDELVVLATGEDTENARPQAGVTIPESIAADIARELIGHPDIEGVIPVHSERVPVLNPRTQLSEPALSLVGVPADGLAAFGNITDRSGQVVDLTTVPENGIVLGEAAAESLNAVAGDTLVAYIGNQPHELVVSAIGPDSILLGTQDPGDPGGFAMPLKRAQALFGRAGEISYVAITNRGNTQEGVRLSESAVTAINAQLEGTPYRAVPVKQDALDLADESASMFVSLFLVFGLFSISVGILLIFLIFVMLAAERQSEMGMARAVGLRRRQLVQMFIAEGIAYDLAAALVGALLGVGVAFLMVGMLSRMFTDFLEIRPIVSWTSLVIAYVLGVTVTFLTIVVSSWRVSKLNIVAAIRNIPEPTRKRAGRRALVLGIGGTILGTLLILSGLQSKQEFPFAIGISMIPFSLALALRHIGLAPRLVYSVASLLALGYWLLPMDVHQRINADLSSGIEMFFVSGIMLVASATVLIIWNASMATGLLTLLGRRFSRWLPSVKTAVAYPLANPMRTGMTVAMFSLVIFSLVMIASISTNLVAMLTGENAGGGWNIFVMKSPNNPLDDLIQELEAQGMDTSVITATGHVDTLFDNRTNIRQVGDTSWSEYNINGVDSAFIDANTIPLQIRAHGYESDAEVWAAIRDNRNLAVIDTWALPTGGAMGADAAGLQLSGIQQSDTTMEPVELEIQDPISGQRATVTIIGVIDSEVSALAGIFMPAETVNEIFAHPSYSAFIIQIQPDADEQAVANEIEARLMTFGVQAISVKEEIEKSAATSRNSLRLFQGFMGLGLVVGIAALGVIAFRSVVERRQQIGMLRAIGFNRRMVTATFVIESSLITLLGVVSGAVLGLWLSWNLLTGDYFLGTGASMSFIIPWGTVVFFLALSLGASLLMAYIPARQAARVPIAESLRYE